MSLILACAAAVSFLTDQAEATPSAAGAIAFVSNRDGNDEIYVMSGEGSSGVTRLTDNPASDRSPAWSPDGRRIAFMSTRDGNSEIYVMNADGTGVTRLTNDPANDHSPAWSPDGSQIAFTRDGAIYVMNADGNGVALLTDRGDQASFQPSASDAWPNQPPNFQAVSDQPWDSLTGNGWSWLRRESSKDPDITMDPTAPLSRQNVLRMIFTPDMEPYNEPSVHWLGLPGSREIYTAYWIKLSPNWTPSPEIGGMMTSLFTDLSGQVAPGLYHPCLWPEACDPDVNGPPYKVGVNTEWDPYGQQIWYPNVTTTWINPGEWHRLEFYFKWETSPGVSGDGIIRWWVDGLLNGDYRAVPYPEDRFVEFQFAPTLPQPPPAEQYMYIDHTRVSVPVP